jgi:hypothetical protein
MNFRLAVSQSAGLPAGFLLLFFSLIPDPDIVRSAVFVSVSLYSAHKLILR